MVRAKFRVDCVQTHNYNGYTGYKILMSPVTRTPDDPDSENTRFWTATPSGKLEIDTTNAAVLDQFKPGSEHYVDFTPSPEVARGNVEYSEDRETGPLSFEAAR